MLGIESYPPGASGVQTYTRGDSSLAICLMETFGVKSLGTLQVAIYRHTEYEGCSADPYSGYLTISIGYVNDYGGRTSLCVARYPEKPVPCATKEELDQKLKQFEDEFTIWQLGTWHVKMNVNTLDADFELNAYLPVDAALLPTVKHFKCTTVHCTLEDIEDLMQDAYAAMDVYKYDQEHHALTRIEQH